MFGSKGTVTANWYIEVCLLEDPKDQRIGSLKEDGRVFVESWREGCKVSPLCSGLGNVRLLVTLQMMMSEYLHINIKLNKSYKYNKTFGVTLALHT